MYVLSLPVVVFVVVVVIVFILAASKEVRRVEFFGDLNEKEASEFANKLREESFMFLRKELSKVLGADGSSHIMVLLQQSKTYPIRQFTDSLYDELRGDVIKTLREVLPLHKGVTGK